jgi:hypothetical protein
LKLLRLEHLICLSFLSLLSGATKAQDSTKVLKSVIGGGGGTTSNSEFSFKGTIGQSGIGLSTTNSYQVHSGFWQGIPLACCIGITGDLDADGSDHTILDLTFLINQIYRGGPDPICLKEGDLDGDGQPLHVLDLTYMINKIFRGGPNPVSCQSFLFSF